MKIKRLLLPFLTSAIVRMVPLCAILTAAAFAQDTVRVPLQIVPATSWDSWSLPYPAEPGPFTLPGNLQLKSLASAASGCKFQLPDGQQVSIPLGGWQIINIQRPLGLLPYAVTCEQAQKNGQAHYYLEWNPQYRAEGRIQVGDCWRLVGVWDLDGDGVFARRDLLVGSGLIVDVKNQGWLGGPGEYFGEGAVFEVCGKRWEVASLSPLGEWIELRESKVPQIEIGGPLPPFMLQTGDGKTIESLSLSGRWSLIDFWASWCVPCLKTFPEVKQLGQETGKRMGIYLVNVDDSDRVVKAKQAIAEYGLPYPKSWSGKGEDDPIWRIFGTKVDGFLAIPLYVLVDSQNHVALITHDLKDVRARVFSQ